MAEAPLGPRNLDLGGLTDEGFEELCHRLVLIDFSDAVATHNPDSGADSLLPKKPGGWCRAWQAKRYTGTIYWAKCKDSLDRAVETYKISRMTFCFAKNLTSGQLVKFDSDLVGRHRNVDVDFWDRDKLLSVLRSSPDGDRIVNHYFGVDPRDSRALIRAVQAGGGELAKPEHAVDRGRAIGEFFSGSDPFFSYPLVTHEADDSGAPAPGLTSMMSVSETEGGVTVRIDAVPRDEEAAQRYAPKISIGFTEDDDGREAARIFEEGLNAGLPISIDRGVEVTPQRLPPRFADQVGKSVKAAIRLQPTGSAKRAIPPWHARVTASGELGEASMEISLSEISRVPEDWDGGVSGTFGGLTISVLMRWRESSGEIAINWKYTFGEDPFKDQAAALTLMKAMHGRTSIKIEDLADARPPLEQEDKVADWDEEMEGLLQTMEDVVTIEDWTDVRLSVPKEITPDEVRDIHFKAAVIRRKALPIRFENARATVDEHGLAEMKSGKQITIVQGLGIELLGQKVPFAEGTLEVPEVEVHEIGRNEAEPSLIDIELLPVGGKAVQAEWLLAPPGDNARKAVAGSD